MGLPPTQIMSLCTKFCDTGAGKASRICSRNPALWSASRKMASNMHAESLSIPVSPAIQSSKYFLHAELRRFPSLASNCMRAFKSANQIAVCTIHSCNLKGFLLPTSGTNSQITQRSTCLICFALCPLKKPLHSHPTTQ